MKDWCIALMKGCTGTSQEWRRTEELVHCREERECWERPGKVQDAMAPKVLVKVTQAGAAPEVWGDVCDKLCPQKHIWAAPGLRAKMAWRRASGHI